MTFVTCDLPSACGGITVLCPCIAQPATQRLTILASRVGATVQKTLQDSYNGQQRRTNWRRGGVERVVQENSPACGKPLCRFDESCQPLFSGSDIGKCLKGGAHEFMGRSNKEHPVHAAGAAVVRTAFLALLSGRLPLRASCFIRRTCLRCPLDNCLRLVLRVLVNIVSAPCTVIGVR
jgi:hypothetical protein